MDLTTTTGFAQIAATIFTGIGLVYAGWQVRLLKKTHSDNHEWNRRVAAQSAAETIRAINHITIELNALFDTENATEAIPLDKILNAFKTDKSIQVKLHQTLNAYEALARGVFHNIYDEGVIKAARRGPMIQQFLAYGAYIRYRRDKVHPKAYIEMEALANKWKAEESAIYFRPATG